MINKIRKTIRNKIIFFLQRYYFYKIEDLQIGGHCGLCGNWIPDEIFPAHWAWGICKECDEKYG